MTPTELDMLRNASNSKSASSTKLYLILSDK